MYVRFVIHHNDKRSGRRQGLFQALAALERTGLLLPHELDIWDNTGDWSRKNLRRPRSFSRSSKPHAKKYVVYQDNNQIAAEPFSETAT